MAYLSGMFLPRPGEVFVAVPAAVALIAAVAGQWMPVTRWLRIAIPRGSARRQLAFGAVVAVSVLMMPPATPPFIYFQF